VTRAARMAVVLLCAWLTCAALAVAAQAPQPVALTVQGDAVLPPPDIDATPNVADSHVLDGTGYMLKRNQVEIGLWQFAYGITDWLNVGTVPELWLLAPLLGGASANLSVRLGLPIGRYVHVSLDANPVWLRVQRPARHVNGWFIPMVLALSVQPTPRQSYSLGARYATLTGNFGGNLGSHEIAGTAVTSYVQITARAEYMFTQAFGLFLNAGIEPWERNIDLNSRNVQLDPQTTADVDGEISAVDNSRPWVAILGVHFRWDILNLRLGVGYGRFFLPRLGLPIRTYEGVVPDVNFYFRF